MEMTENQILKYALQNGILDLSTIQTQIEMNERKKYLEKHNHAIWQGKDGYYYTKVDDSRARSGRRLIKKSNKDVLNDAIIDFYKSQQNEPYIDDVFYGWINQKLAYGEIKQQTYERYEVDYKRFFDGTKISGIKFRYITQLELEDFIKSAIHDKSLTAKAWGNLRTLIKGMFKYAKKQGYTNISITEFFGDLDISRKAFTINRKQDEQCVFSEIEMEILIKHLMSNPTLGNLGVLIAAYTGMRMGEVIALKWEDITDEYIYVHRMQIRIKENGKNFYKIEDTTKTEAGIRKVVIVPKLRPILKHLRKINPFTEYVFEKDGKVLTKHMLENSINRACEKIGIPKRSMHVLRKTYATRLLNAKVDEAIITRQLGHTDIATTKAYYYYNDKSLDYIAKTVGKIINY